MPSLCSARLRSISSLMGAIATAVALAAGAATVAAAAAAVRVLRVVLCGALLYNSFLREGRLGRKLFYFTSGVQRSCSCTRCLVVHGANCTTSSFVVTLADEVAQGRVRSA